MSEYRNVYELRGLIGLTPEQLLIIADEVCHQHHCSITKLLRIMCRERCYNGRHFRH